MAVRQYDLAPEAVAYGRGHASVVAFRRPRRAVDLVRLAANAALALVAVLCLAVGLVSVGPRVLPYRVLPVLTGSMEPAVPTGSLLIVTMVSASDLRVGDVITFQHPLQPRAYVTHRIVAIEEDGGRRFVTQGDVNPQPDPWRVLAQGQGYRVWAAIPEIGGALVAFESSVLRIALFAVPMIVLAAFTLAWIWRPARPQLRALPPVQRLAARVPEL